MEQTKPKNRIKNISLIVAPILCILFVIFFDLKPGQRVITYTAAIALLMAFWWITEALHLGVTALLPLILFPVFGIMDGETVAGQYFNSIILLFLGGFMVALAMERWNLHKRIALKILMMLGVEPRFILLGFMLATGFISMWTSNTATAMMMVPIAMAIITNLEEMLGKDKLKNFPVGIFLGIAYASSIGGIATLIGTPPNPIFVKIFAIYFPKAPEISFAKWFFIAFPISIIFLLVAWLFLSFLFCSRTGIKIDRQTFSTQYKALGPISFEEKIVLLDFLVLIFLWIFRADIEIGGLTIPGWTNLFSKSKFIDDGTVAITMAFLLFLIPSKKQKESRIMDWKTAVKLPWGIMFLFGGGFALASGFKESGLSAWLGDQMKGLASLHPILIIACVCLIIIFLTEFTSNTATAQIVLPILATLAVSINMNPLLLMIPGTLACSLGFMMPAGTPPNAIVFSTERIRISQMARTGFLLNLIGVVLVTAAIVLFGKLVFDIDLAAAPAWMK